MEQASQTLHDFVLNLLSDGQALAAFEQDPAAMLDHAGLSDISAADVQEVIPLVIDYVPAHAEVLDAALSELPLDSVDAGQIGAIQQLQFVTQALSTLPGLDTAGAFGDNSLGGVFHLAGGDALGAVGDLGLTTPLTSGAGHLAVSATDGVVGAFGAHSVIGDLNGEVNVPGMPSGFSAASDVTDALDGQVAPLAGTLVNGTGSVGNAAAAASSAANLLAGATDLTAGALANPGAVVNAFTTPGAAVSALTGTVESYAAYGTASLPAPAGAVASEAVQTVGSTAHGVLDPVAGHLPALPQVPALSAVDHLPAVPVAGQVASTVQGVVGQVAGAATGPLSSTLAGVTGGHADAGQVVHGLGAGTDVVQTVTGTVSGVVSHTPLGDITGVAGPGLGNLLSPVTHTDAGATTDHSTPDLHLPLF